MWIETIISNVFQQNMIILLTKYTEMAITNECGAQFGGNYFIFMHSHNIALLWLWSCMLLETLLAMS